MIITQKINYSYLLITVFSFMLQKYPNLTNYSVFNCFIFLFSLKRFLLSLPVASSSSFFSLKKFPYIFKYVVSFFKIFFKPWPFHHHMFIKKLIIKKKKKTKSVLYSYSPLYSLQSVISRVSNTEILWIMKVVMKVCDILTAFQFF